MPSAACSVGWQNICITFSHFQNICIIPGHIPPIYFYLLSSYPYVFSTQLLQSGQISFSVTSQGGSRLSDICNKYSVAKTLQQKTFSVTSQGGSRWSDICNTNKTICNTYFCNKSCLWWLHRVGPGGQISVTKISITKISVTKMVLSDFTGKVQVVRYV